MNIKRIQNFLYKERKFELSVFVAIILGIAAISEKIAITIIIIIVIVIGILSFFIPKLDLDW